MGFLSIHAIPLFHEAGRLGRITAMAIDPRRQRMGIGAALMGAAEGFAWSVGCSRVEVTSGDGREKDAHLFYQGQGFRSDCRRFLKRFEGTRVGAEGQGFDSVSGEPSCLAE